MSSLMLPAFCSCPRDLVSRLAAPRFARPCRLNHLLALEFPSSCVRFLRLLKKSCVAVPRCRTQLSHTPFVDDRSATSALLLQQLRRAVRVQALLVMSSPQHWYCSDYGEALSKLISRSLAHGAFELAILKHAPVRLSRQAAKSLFHLSHQAPELGCVRVRSARVQEPEFALSGQKCVAASTHLQRLVH